MLKATFKFLFFDDKIQRIRIAMVSTHSFCEARGEETLDHVLSIKKVASMVWEKVASMLGIHNV